MKNSIRTLLILAILAYTSLAVATPTAAHTDDPQPCDTGAQALTVHTGAAAIHDAPNLDATTTTTVPKDSVLIVRGQQANEDVGCWYEVQTLTGSLSSPAWIAGSTVNVSVRTDTLSSTRPSASPQPTASVVPTPTPVAVPYYAPPAYVPTAPYAPYNPANPYGVPLSPTPSAPPTTTGTPQGGTGGTGGTANGELLVPRIVRGQVCLDANANTYCDVNEGVAGVPAYVVGAGGQVVAQTRTDGDGIISVVVQAPQRAQLTINVPYLSAYERVSSAGESAAILVPIGAAIPGLLP